MTWRGLRKTPTAGSRLRPSGLVVVGLGFRVGELDRFLASPEPAEPSTDPPSHHLRRVALRDGVGVRRGWDALRRRRGLVSRHRRDYRPTSVKWTHSSTAPTICALSYSALSEVNGLQLVSIRCTKCGAENQVLVDQDGEVVLLRTRTPVSPGYPTRAPRPFPFESSSSPPSPPRLVHPARPASALPRPAPTTQPMEPRPLGGNHEGALTHRGSGDRRHPWNGGRWHAVRSHHGHIPRQSTYQSARSCIDGHLV